VRKAGIKVAPIRQAIRKTLEGESRADAEVSVLLVDNSRIRELNRLYRGVDSATDVLAFAMGEGEFADLHPEIIGDVVISVEKAEEQAQQAGHGLIDELRLLAVHGTLHLLGHEDESVSGRSRMRRRERKYLKNEPITRR
jgi:probable rRNA maturation factor